MHLPLRSFLLGAFVTSVLTSPIVPGFIQGDDVAVVVEERGLWRRNNPPEPQPGSDAGGKSALNMQDMRKRVEYLRCLQYWKVIKASANPGMAPSYVTHEAECFRKHPVEGRHRHRTEGAARKAGAFTSWEHDDDDGWIMPDDDDDAMIRPEHGTSTKRRQRGRRRRDRGRENGGQPLQWNTGEEPPRPHEGPSKDSLWTELRDGWIRYFGDPESGGVRRNRAVGGRWRY